MLTKNSKCFDENKKNYKVALQVLKIYSFSVGEILVISEPAALLLNADDRTKGN